MKPEPPRTVEGSAAEPMVRTVESLCSEAAHAAFVGERAIGFGGIGNVPDFAASNKAKSYYIHAVGVDPDFPEAWSGLIGVYGKLRDEVGVEHARREWLRTLGHFRPALCFFQRRYPGAIDHYFENGKEVRIFKADTDARFELGMKY